MRWFGEEWSNAARAIGALPDACFAGYMQSFALSP